MMRDLIENIERRACPSCGQPRAFEVSDASSERARWAARAECIRCGFVVEMPMDTKLSTQPITGVGAARRNALERLATAMHRVCRNPISPADSRGDDAGIGA